VVENEIFTPSAMHNNHYASFKKSSAIRKYFFLILALTTAGLITSCQKKVDKIKNFDILTLPSITVKNSCSVLDDSGKVQLILYFPLLETYNNTDAPYSEFRMGIKVIFYDGKKDSVGSVTAEYARYTDKKKLWELKDSVVVVNFESNYKLETEQLFWDQQKDIIYNDRFVKFTNEDQSVFGTGFESDSRLNKRKIKNVSGPIYLRDE
jgi:LPS export ABC transporter protein LptC